MVIKSGCQLNWISGVDDQLSPPRCTKTQLSIKITIAAPIICMIMYSKRKSPCLCWLIAVCVLLGSGSILFGFCNRCCNYCFWLCRFSLSIFFLTPLLLQLVVLFAQNWKWNVIHRWNVSNRFYLLSCGIMIKRFTNKNRKKDKWNVCIAINNDTDANVANTKSFKCKIILHHHSREPIHCIWINLPYGCQTLCVYLHTVNKPYRMSMLIGTI